MARIRPARAYQRHDDPAMLIAAMGRPAVRKAIRDALKHLPEVMDATRAETLYRAGRWREIADTIDWQHFRQVLKAAFERIAQVYEAGARLGVRKINGAFAAKRRKVRFRKISTSDVDEGSVAGNLAALFDVSKAIGDRFNFDRFAQSTQDRLRSYQDALISDLETGARNTIEAVVLSGTRAGLSAGDIVGDIRSMINLTDTQATAVLNYRSMLQNMDSGALRRQLRDDAFDAAFRSAREAGTDLDAAVIDEMVGAYENNYLDYRANTIAGSESVRAANVGLHDAYSQAIERGAFPDDAVRRFWQTSMLENVCPVCLSIPDMNPDGVGVSEDFQSIDGPVADPPDPHTSCLPGDMRVNADRVDAATKRWFDGNLIVIRTASGNQLACTPNHPVLTNGGWRAAHLLDVGDDVIRSLRGEGSNPLLDADHENVPTAIKEIADAVGRRLGVFPVPVPISAKDFHGDGMDGQVAIIWTDRKLRDRRLAALNQPIREGALVLAYTSNVARIGLRALCLFFYRMLATCRRAVRRLNHVCALVFSETCPVCAGGIGYSPDRSLGEFQPSSNDRSGHAKFYGNVLFGHSVSVEPNSGFIDGKPAARFAGTLHGDAVRLQDHRYPNVVDADLARDLLAGKAGPVEADRIVDISLRVFSGHVYNLQTKGGFYVAEGIVTHNCACSVEYITDLDKVPDDATEAA